MIGLLVDKEKDKVHILQHYLNIPINKKGEVMEGVGYIAKTYEDVFVTDSGDIYALTKRSGGAKAASFPKNSTVVYWDLK